MMDRAQELDKKVNDRSLMNQQLVLKGIQDESTMKV